MPKRLTIATRASQLAMWQATHVRDELLKLDPELDIELADIKTIGDKRTDVTLNKIGGKGLFVKEVEARLLDSSADVAVHSLKDLTSEMPDELVIAAYPEREDPRDAFVSNAAPNLGKLKPGSVVGTASLRRAAQVLRHRPELTTKPLRGNIDTRLSKLDAGEFDAIILACAGLRRMGWDERITEAVAPETLLPAVGQGCLAIQCRRKNEELAELLTKLNHEPTQFLVEAERAFLAHIEGSCATPMAAYAVLDEENIRMRAMVSSLDGRKVIEAEETFAVSERVEQGTAMAEDILGRGGKELLDKIRQQMADNH